MGGWLKISKAIREDVLAFLLSLVGLLIKLCRLNLIGGFEAKLNPLGSN